jgi:hypothetical protein
MTPVLPTERIAHLSHGRRLLRCGIFGAWADSRTACGGRLWPDRPRRPAGQRLCFEARWWDCAESVAMNENGIDTPEQVLNLPRRSYVTPVEEAGQAIIAKIQKAADLSNENCDRAMALAHKLSMQLRAAEDRINQLQAEVELFRDRARLIKICSMWDLPAYRPASRLSRNDQTVELALSRNRDRSTKTSESSLEYQGRSHVEIGSIQSRRRTRRFLPRRQSFL